MRPGIDCIGIATVFACHDGEGNYLFSKRSENARDEQGTWDPGGGKIEFGDTAEETIRKEIREEYCTDVLSFEFLGFRDVHRIVKEQGSHWVALDFRVLVNRATVKNGEPHKMTAVEWFKLNNLPSPMHSQWPTFFKNYRLKLL